MTGSESKKNHHVVPKLYLQGFADHNDMVWTYLKNDPQKKPYPQKPKNVAIERYFYALHLNDGTIDTNTFEDALADIIETPAADGLKAIKAGNIPSHDDRQRLSLLFGFMLVRTPKYKMFYERQHNREFNLKLKLIASDKNNFQDWADKYKRIRNEPLGAV